MDRISSKPEGLTTIFESRTNFFYNNSNKLWIELLCALLCIDIGVEYSKNITNLGLLTL